MSTFCTACGNGIGSDDKFCRVCGYPAPATGSTTAAAPPPSSPVGATATSGKAVASFVFGLLFFVPFSFLAAIVFGHLALSEIKKSAGRLKGEGLAITGLIFGYLWVVAIPFILIIAAIAIPNLLRARIAANESSAVAAIHTLNNAEAAYSGTHSGGYTCSLSDLEEGRFIDRQLASGKMHGYAFELRNCGPAAGNQSAKYQVAGYPLVSRQTGIRAFCSDENAVIKVDSGGSSEACLETGSPLR